MHLDLFSVLFVIDNCFKIVVFVCTLTQILTSRFMVFYHILNVWKKKIELQIYTRSSCHILIGESKVICSNSDCSMLMQDLVYSMCKCSHTSRGKSWSPFLFTLIAWKEWTDTLHRRASRWTCTRMQSHFGFWGPRSQTSPIECQP